MNLKKTTVGSLSLAVLAITGATAHANPIIGLQHSTDFPLTVSVNAFQTMFQTTSAGIAPDGAILGPQSIDLERKIFTSHINGFGYAALQAGIDSPGSVAGSDVSTTIVSMVLDADRAFGSVPLRATAPLFFDNKGDQPLHYSILWNARTLINTDPGARFGMSVSATGLDPPHMDLVSVSNAFPGNLGGIVSGEAAPGSRKDVWFDASMTPTTDSKVLMAFDFIVAFDDQPNPVFFVPGRDEAHPLVSDFLNGAFDFHFLTAGPELTFIDPIVATGYDYVVSSGSNLRSVRLPTGFGDNLFDLLLADSSGTCVDSGIDLTGGIEYYFNSVDTSKFCIRGIEVGDAPLAGDPGSFTTGLSFLNSGFVDVRQTPVLFDTGDGTGGPTSVPEPGTFALFIAGIAGLGGLRRLGRDRWT